MRTSALADPGGDSDDSSITWEDFFGTTTAEDLVPTLLNMYDTLIGRPSVVAPIDEGINLGRIESTPQRPKEPPPPPPPPLIGGEGARPLSVTSIASSSSSSSSSVTSSCSGRRRLPSKAYLASIESLDDSEDEASPSSSLSKAGSHGSQDSGVCSPCSYISSPSPPHSKPRYCDPHLSYMDRVVMEIIETEGVYVSDLRQVIVGYIERWESSLDCQLSDKQMFDLFGNLRQIYTFNSSFLKELEQCGLDPVKVARVFVKNNAGFSIYTDYCTNYPKTVSVLTELMRQESAVRLFRERQSALNHTLPLGSYLLKPVQRILKYHLLLQNMVKGSRPDVDGYGDIVDALTAMTSIAHHINDMKRRHEHAVRVQEIQSLLLGWQGEDLTTFGELCAEGTFRMAGAKALRHAFLFDQILLITKKKEEGILGYKTHIMCSNLMLIESVPGEPLSFHVIPFDNPKHQYTLQARSLEQKREWTLQLKRVILENYHAVIPSHARQIVMQLGQNRTDDEIMAERATPKKQHSAPEYLERRKQGERRKSESSLRARLGRGRKADNSIRVKMPPLRRGSEAPSEESIELKSDDVKITEPVTHSSTALHISETDLSETSGQHSPLAPEERNLKDIATELLVETKKFQRTLKKQRHLASRRHRTPHPAFQSSTSRTETSDDDEDEEDDVESCSHLRSSRSLSGQREGDYDNLRNVWETVRGLECIASLKRAQSFTSQSCEESSTATVSLSSSDTSFDVPTSPAVWLKQQRAHLAAPTTPTKAGSLPRGFQLGGPPDWQHKARVSPDRPFTIASDKAQELNLDDMQRYCDSQHDKLTRHRFPLPDDTTEDDSTPDATTQQLNVHPEYKIYRPSLTKATLKQVISSVSSKLAHLRLSSEALDQLDDSHNRANRFMTAFAKTFAKKRRENDSIASLPVYKQGSSALGARLAQGTDNSDYADPRTLFPNITGSRKAAALLGIRPYSALSLGSSSSSGYAASHYRGREEIETVESDGSADSFYERSFEAIDSTMSHDVCRDSAIYSETDDSEPNSYQPALAMAVTIKRIPPPVPDKPPNLRLWRHSPQLVVTSSSPSLPTPPLASPEDEYDSSSVASTVIETSPTKGWVKQIIGKIQGGQTPVSPNS